MGDVLVATLGEAPIVVTAMVKALRELKGITIRTVYILYPVIETERLICLGYDMIQEHLRGVCQVKPWPLDFADANSCENSIQFLRTLAGVLDLCEQAGDTVYLSLAGGRKNMSALLAVITQFYPGVRGLYHLLDRFEYDKLRRNFYTIQELFAMDENQRTAKLSPLVENLKLVEIPYAWFANASELRRYFAAENRGEDFVLQTSGVADAFFSSIFQPQTELPLQLYLSQTAFEEYQQFGLQIQQNFDHCFHRMTNAQLLESHKHSKFGNQFQTDCSCFKMGRTQERPFYYRDKDKVIVCRLTLHGSTYEQLISKGELWRNDHLPFKPLSHLHRGEAVLLVPLGETPMIATQTSVLLSERESLQISYIVALYPEGHASVRNSADLLADLCDRRGVYFEKKPIRNLKDIDSDSACKTYLGELLKAIDELRAKYPAKQIVLSLSGGRKGMSALSLFAAQRTGIGQVYHTLITDPALEDRIERECSLEVLNKLTPKQQAARLFLENYDHNQFALFPIPVISVR
jgi:hypothetical protein